MAESGSEWLVVTQNDHAALAADLLSAWRSLATLPQRELLLRATRLHDNGWSEPDAAPRVDPDGAPRDFLGISPRERRELWVRGVERYLRTEPPCAALIAEHAIQLHGDRAEDPDIAELVAAAKRAQDEVIEDDPSAADLVRDLYPWIRLADDLSLRVCMRRSGAFRLEMPSHLPFAVEIVAPSDASVSWKICLSPFPLAGPTTFPVRCRRIPRRRYRSDAELGAELATARFRDEPLRVEAVRAGT